VGGGYAPMRTPTVEELRRTNTKYQDRASSWKLFLSIYKGVDSLLKNGYIPKHEREPQSAYERRIKELYSFGYSKSVVKILTFHLFNKPPIGRQLKALESNKIWEMFFRDSNLQGDHYDLVLRHISLYASILGHMGVLVDKGQGFYQTKKEQKDAKIYPYIASYQPPAILDWEWGINENKRPVLKMVKLLDDDGTYRIWTEQEWGTFIIEKSTTNAGSNTNPNIGVPVVNINGPGPERKVSIGMGMEQVKPVASGINPLKEVPFFWFYNLKTEDNFIGESDIEDIARTDLSVIKNTSQIEEIINFAAFPMMLKPRLPADPSKSQQSVQEDEVSVQIIQEYDPEYPESKPEWMKPEVESAVRAILDTISKKVQEIYRAANIGGITSTEVSTQAKSGVALKTEFQMLNSNLVSKAINLEKAENKILEFFLKWEMLWDELKNEVHFGRSKNFDVQEISVDLANALTAKTVVMSDTFNALLQKQTARQVLPSMSEDEQMVIDKEIEQSIQKKSEVTVTEQMDQEDPETQAIMDKGMGAEQEIEE